MLRFLRLFLAALFPLALEACSGGAPTGPNPTPTETPKSYLKIIGNFPESGSVVCTGGSQRDYLVVSLAFNLVENYSPMEMWFYTALSNDGINPILEAGQPAIFGVSWRSSATFQTADASWTPFGGARSSQWLLATYEYRPRGPHNEEGRVIVAKDRKEWRLTFNPSC